MAFEDPNCALPVDRAARHAGIVFLIVHKGLEFKLARAHAHAPGYGVADPRARGAPTPAGQEDNLPRAERLQASIRLPKRGTDPEWMALVITNLKGHQRATACKVHTQPVPA